MNLCLDLNLYSFYLKISDEGVSIKCMAWAGAWRWPLAGRQVRAAADAHAMHGVGPS